MLHLRQIVLQVLMFFISHSVPFPALHQSRVFVSERCILIVDCIVKHTHN